MTQGNFAPVCYRCGKVIEGDIVLIPKSMDEPIREDAEPGTVFRHESSLMFAFDKPCLDRLKRQNGTWKVDS